MAANGGITTTTLNANSVSTNTLSATGNTNIGGSLAVTGATTLTGALAANGGITTTTLNANSVSANTLSATGNANIGGTLAVTGATTLTGALTANGGITTTTLNATTITASNLSTTGNSAVAGNSTVGGSLSVTGQTLTHGINNSGSQITNVANGTTTYDAVNYGQLTSATSALKTEIEANDRVARYGIASAAAMSNLPGIDAGKTFGVGAAFGSYKGATSVAAGFSARVAPSGVVKASAAVADSDVTVGLGFGLSF